MYAKPSPVRPFAYPTYLRVVRDDEPTPPEPSGHNLPADGEPLTLAEHLSIWFVILAFCVFDVALARTLWRAAVTLWHAVAR